MATGDGWTSRLLVGLAEHLAADGIGVWRPAGAYTAAETGILIRAIPASPDRIITLAAYPVDTPGDGTADFTQGVQVRMRGTTNPLDVEDLGDEVFKLLASSGRQTWGTSPAQVYIVDVNWASATSLGQDGNGRWESSHNYYVKAMRPTSNRNE